MNKIAHIFSWVLSPILLPTYAIFLALWTSYLALLPVSVRWGVLVVSWLITCLLPMIAIIALYKLKIISHPGLNERKERFIPYVITALCYCACSFYLHNAHAPHWLWMFMVAGAVAAVVSCVVNLWWKISAHMAAIGGLLALALYISTHSLAVVDMRPIIMTVILLTGILGTSRMLLNCHTFWQVMAGAANGIVFVYMLI